MEEKPQVGKAILFALIGVVALYICQFVLHLGISLGFELLFKVPVINRLLAALFRARGDSPEFFAPFVAAVLSYSAIVWVLHRFCDDWATESLSLKISGSILLVCNIAFFILNISAKEPVLINIILAVTGLFILIRGCRKKDD